MRPGLTILALSAAISVASSARADPLPLAPEPTDQPETRSRFEEPLFVAGSLTFLTSYGVGAGVGALTLNDNNRGLYIPLVGPWIALAENHPCEGDCSDRGCDDALLVLDGLVQAGGVAMMATSLFQSYERKQQQRGTHLAVTGSTVGILVKF